MVKMQVYFVVVFATLARATDSDFHHIVARAIQDATEWHEINFGNATKFAHGSGCPYAAAKSTPASEEMSKISTIYEKAARILVDDHGMERSLVASAMASTLPAQCQGNPRVDPCVRNSRYRTIDGTCNNLANVAWGAANTPFTRFVRAGYQDGVDEPRGGRSTFSLPNPREVSNLVHWANNAKHGSVTHMLPVFGQFVDHDVTATAGEGRRCCTTESNFPDCFPINIPFGDPFYARHGQSCIDFTRSTAYCFRPNGVREQMNTITAFLDCSMIYGSDLDTMTQVRSFGGGRLRTNKALKGFLPVDNGGAFFAGDGRVNENPGISALQNLFLMEHNRIAALIAAKQRGWNDEIIFQETRRIVTAEFQQIVYNEYLPAVLGPSAMSSYDLKLNGFRSIYQENVNPTIYNSFATAAYRFGHSLIGGNYQLVNTDGRFIGSFQLRDNFLDEGQRQITQGSGQGYDWVLGGLLVQNMEQTDTHCTDDLRNFLFKSAGSNFGSDLIAANIQRGRDHGLPSYNEFRKACGLPGLTGWASPPREIAGDDWLELRRSTSQGPIYSSPQDIDLFTGGLMEIPVAGGLTGPTFNCIMANQFRNLKIGDRYFFTHQMSNWGFTDAQLRQLSTRTLGDIICENSQQIQIQRNVFFTPSSSNPIVRCGDSSRSTFDMNKFFPSGERGSGERGSGGNLFCAFGLLC